MLTIVANRPLNVNMDSRLAQIVIATVEFLLGDARGSNEGLTGSMTMTAIALVVGTYDGTRKGCAGGADCCSRLQGGGCEKRDGDSRALALLSQVGEGDGAADSC